MTEDRRCFKTESILALIPDEGSGLREKAEEILQERGLFTVQEELSRPKLFHNETPLLPFLSISALHCQEVADVETISLNRSCHIEDVTFSLDSCAKAMRINVLKTGCSSLDQLLCGGMHVGAGSIIEISGKAGVGKTQIALQIALMTAAPLLYGGLQSQCIFAYSEGRLPIRRLIDIDKALCSRFKLTSGTLLHGVIVETIRSADALRVWSETRLPFLLRKTNARVVIVDSITAVYRPEFENAVSRAKHMASMASALKKAAASVKGICICVNQVSQKLDGPGHGSVIPALGSVWGSAVETRVFLRRAGTRRFARILDSAHIYDTSEEHEYQISTEGVSCGD